MRKPGLTIIPKHIYYIVANIVLLFLWACFFRPVYPYLKTIFTREEFRTNQVVLLAVIFLIFLQVRKGDLRPHLYLLPQLYFPALALILGGSVLFLVSERYLDINTLSASMFGLVGYGLLGLWINPQHWIQGLPAALLLIGALPFGEHIQTFIGYPVRIFTAGLIGDVMAKMGVPSIGIDTILIFENGISQVDLPCSGIKSLWTGGLFLLAVTWIERHSLNLRWVWVALIFAFLLLSNNLIRVGVLVAVGQVMGFQLLAEMMHVPLGLIGFVISCSAAIWLLRHIDYQEDRPVEISNKVASSQRPVWLVLALSASILVMILLYAPRAQPVVAKSLPNWQLPANIEAKPLPLTHQEIQWLSQIEAESANRWRFRWHDQTGTILIVSSTTWRAHHHPERCFEAYGLKVNNSFTYLAAPNFPLRLVSLGKGSQRNLLSATYWLQSSDHATDDYASRIWSDLDPERQRWVQITILFDERGNPISDQSLELYKALRQSIARSLHGGL